MCEIPYLFMNIGFDWTGPSDGNIKSTMTINVVTLLPTVSGVTFQPAENGRIQLTWDASQDVSYQRPKISHVYLRTWYNEMKESTKKLIKCRLRENWTPSYILHRLTFFAEPCRDHTISRATCLFFISNFHSTLCTFARRKKRVSCRRIFGDLILILTTGFTHALSMPL